LGKGRERGRRSSSPVFWEVSIRQEARSQFVHTAQRPLPGNWGRGTTEVTGEEKEALQCIWVGVGLCRPAQWAGDPGIGSPEQVLGILEANGLGRNWGSSRDVVKV
jgi:hypothetical protein